MKTTSILLPFALCAAALPGFAQTGPDVSLKGFLKVGVDSVAATGATNPAGDRSAIRRMSDNTSYWYISAKEDLGGGFGAFAHMEFDFGLDNGVGGQNRNFGVGLSSPYGRMLFGRWSTYFTNHILIDPSGILDAAPLAGNSLNLLGSINGGYFAGGFMNNVIRYESPRWNGLATTLTYGLESETPNAAGANPRMWNLNPSYVHGPIAVMYSHLSRTNQAAVVPVQNFLGGSGSIDQTADRIGAAYGFPFGVRVGVLVDRNRINDKSTGSTQSRVAWTVPVSYHQAQHTFQVNFGRAQEAKLNGATAANTGAKMLIATYNYDFSKRTAVAMTYARISNESAGRYDFWGRSLGGNVAPAMPVNAAGADPRMLYVGVRHTF